MSADGTKRHPRGRGPASAALLSAEPRRDSPATYATAGHVLSPGCPGPYSGSSLFTVGRSSIVEHTKGSRSVRTWSLFEVRSEVCRQTGRGGRPRVAPCLERCGHV